MEIEISNGELIDKLTILEIKLNYITALTQKDNIKKEYTYLKEKSQTLILNPTIYNLYRQLQKVNLKLWKIEDSIRLKEKLNEFDNEFINLARSVYKTNDERANIKKQINQITISTFIEEKSYEQY